MDNKTYSTDFKCRAISWAAAKCGMSYGEFIMAHENDEIRNTFQKYEKYLESRKRMKEAENKDMT